MEILKAVELLIFSAMMTAAIAPSHQHTTQSDVLRSWLRDRRYNSHGLQTAEWASESSLINLRNDSEYLSESKNEGRRKSTDYLPHGLPGQPTGMKFRQYSGYVTVNASAGRALFYYFAEAFPHPSKRPLVLWFNGGPGCSSLGYGAMTELGPFWVNPDGKTLRFNRYSWNRAANILFLESPAGVGFSYSNTTSDYNKSGDSRTAADAYAFLVNWFRRFPKYKSRDFYISGESYAGHFVPELAATILYQQKKSQASFINLKGILVGNGVMDNDKDRIGIFTYPWSHALMSDETYNSLIDSCTKEELNSNPCVDAQNQMYTEIGNINPYSIYTPICSTNLSKEEETAFPGYDPCIDDYVYTYFNRRSVQKGIHANVTKLPYPWNQCSSILNWTEYGSRSMIPTYRRLIAAGLRILLFSGDTDTVVPVTSTRLSINALKLPVETPWYPWVNGGEVGGYTVIYKGLTFATVRGAGHQVPSFQPSRALTLLKYYLKGKPLPK